MRAMNDFDTVRDYLTGLQDRICHAIEGADGRVAIAQAVARELRAVDADGR